MAKKKVIIQELEKNRGKQFNPKIVPHMLEMIQDGFVECLNKDEL